MEIENEYVDPVEKEVQGVLSELKEASKLNEADPTQATLVNTIQRLRAQILDVAAMAYIAKPGHSELLSALNSMFGQMEKSVRDDRKEEERKKDKEDNRATFNQLIEAATMLASGEIKTPDWGNKSFFLDPNMSFTDVTDIGKIRDDEIRMGHITTDIDGNEV